MCHDLFGRITLISVTQIVFAGFERNLPCNQSKSCKRISINESVGNFKNFYDTFYNIFLRHAGK